MARGFPIRKDGPDPEDLGTSPLEMRRALTGLVLSTPGPVHGLVVTGTSGWAYAVTAGVHIGRRGGTWEPDGITLTAHDQTTVDTDPAPGSGSRWDIVYARQRDVEHGDPDGEGVIDVAVGTVGGAAPVGDLPEGAVELRRFQVSAGMPNTAAATISDVGRTQAAVQPISRGGTAATTAAGARENLGAAEGWTGPLPVTRGGTGGNTPAAARAVLGAAAIWPPRAARAVTGRRDGTGAVSAGSFTAIHAVSLPAGAPAGLYRVTVDLVLTASTAGKVDVRCRAASPTVAIVNDDPAYIGSPGGNASWTGHLEHSGGARVITLSVQPAVAGMAAPAGTRITAEWIGPLAEATP